MQHPELPDHARHDAILIAGHAAGDLSEIDRARADAQLASCGACADLRRDLVAIAAATRSVPAPATLGRDLRLAPEQADRLRRGSWLRTFLRPFGAAGSPFRPMATAFTSLGVVGLVVGITLSSGLGPAAGAPGAAGGQGFNQDRANAQAPSGAPAAEATSGAAAEHGGGFNTYAPMVQSTTDAAALYRTTPPRQAATDDKAVIPTSVVFDGNAGGGRSTTVGADQDPEIAAPTASPQPPNPLIAGSLALLGIGLLLFGLRIASRRVR